MVRKHWVVLVTGALTLGASGWLASTAAAATSAVEHDAVAVVGSGTSVVDSLDEHGHANQTTVAAADSQTAENDSDTQEHNADLQEGNSGTNEDGSANDSQAQVSDSQAQNGETGVHETASANNGDQQEHQATSQDTNTDTATSGSPSTNG